SLSTILRGNIAVLAGGCVAILATRVALTATLSTRARGNVDRVAGTSRTTQVGLAARTILVDLVARGALVGLAAGTTLVGLVAAAPTLIGLVARATLDRKSVV